MGRGSLRALARTFSARGAEARPTPPWRIASRITAVDPVKHGLLFERFLSEMRVDGQTEAPDIDVDFEHDRREEVLDYMYDHYDRDRTRRSRASCRRITRRMPAGCDARVRVSRRAGERDLEAHALRRSLDGAESVRDELGREVRLGHRDARGRTMLAAMAAFEDLPRLRATHVGGFVLSCEPLGDYMPIEHTTMGRTIMQFDKDDLDAVGVPKFDFLGLGALSLVRRAFDVIEVRTGEAAADVQAAGERSEDVRADPQR